MTPKYLIIHHTATSRDKTTFMAVKNHHIRKGWGNIGYHFFISGNGSLYGYPEARGQDRIGAHCIADSMNYKSIGIALTGNFEKEYPSEKQLKTLINLIIDLKKVWDIPMSNVLGHKEVKGASTACPGKYLMMFLSMVRRSIKNEEALNNVLELLERSIKIIEEK